MQLWSTVCSSLTCGTLGVASQFLRCKLYGHSHTQNGTGSENDKDEDDEIDNNYDNLVQLVLAKITY
jgi:hypothetical protein